MIQLTAEQRKILCYVKGRIVDFAVRSLSSRESKVVLALSEQGRRETTREDIIRLLGTSPQAADHVIRSLRRKGWLERGGWGRYLLIPPEQGSQALGESNLLALASSIANPYYFGFATAAAHYGLTTQLRSTIFLVTPKHVRPKDIQGTKVRIVKVAPRRFFGFGPVDALGYPVMMSDREKTVLDCIDRPQLAGGIGEAATILAAAARRFDWDKAASYLERIGSVSLIRRLGWLADQTGADIPESVRVRMHSMADRPGVSFVGPRKPAGDVIGYAREWHLMANVAPPVIAESVGRAKRHKIGQGA
jgi:predicted transcriptional regulator of viral defense system